MALDKVVRKGFSDLHFVNETTEGNALGKHLAATVVKVVSQDPEVVNLFILYEDPTQHPAGSDPNIHIWKPNKARDSVTQAVNTWHYRDECGTGE